MTSKMPGTELAKLARDFRATASATDSAIFDFLSALDCPRSLAVWLLYKNKEHQQLVDMGIRPEWYNNSERFRTAYAATEFLSKSDFLKLDVNKKDAAFKKFFEFEELCKATDRKSVV